MYYKGLPSDAKNRLDLDFSEIGGTSTCCIYTG